MNFIKNIFLFFKKTFNKKSDIKMIEVPTATVSNADKMIFTNSLKTNVVKNKVETLTCVGDGLGIQTKISY